MTSRHVNYELVYTCPCIIGRTVSAVRLDGLIAKTNATCSCHPMNNNSSVIKNDCFSKCVFETDLLISQTCKHGRKHLVCRNSVLKELIFS